MKQFIKTAIPLALGIFIFSCGDSNGDETNANTKDTVSQENHEEMGMDKTASSGVTVKDDKLNAVYQHYVHLTTALVKGDAAEAKLASNAIEAGAKVFDGGAAVASTAAKITNAADIESQRVAFSTLSNDFIALVKKSGLKSGELYVDFCPMALEDKGAYWLSANKEIKNPYFGDKMLTCGEVKETIK